MDAAESRCMTQMIPPSKDSFIGESVCANKNCSQTTEEIIFILSTEQTHIHDIILVLKYLLCYLKHSLALRSSLLLCLDLIFFSLIPVPLMRGLL